MWSFLKNHIYKYRLERAYELLCYLILVYPKRERDDRRRIEGLEQARRILRAFLDGEHEQVIKDIKTKYGQV